MVCQTGWIPPCSPTHVFVSHYGLEFYCLLRKHKRPATGLPAWACLPTALFIGAFTCTVTEPGMGFLSQEQIPFTSWHMLNLPLPAHQPEALLSVKDILILACTEQLHCPQNAIWGHAVNVLTAVWSAQIQQVKPERCRMCPDGSLAFALGWCYSPILRFYGSTG